MKMLVSSAVVAASMLGFSDSVAHAQELTNVRVALPWFRNGQYASLMAADVNGYFKEEGIQLEIIDGGPGKNVVLTVGSGQSEFGITFPRAIVAARTADQPIDITAVGCILQDTPYSWFTLVNPGDPDPQPKDMAGKRIGIQSDGEVFIKAVAEKYGIDLSTIQLSVVQGGAEPLLTGAVDYVSGWITDVPYKIEVETAKADAPENIKGKQWKAIMFSRVAFPNYNDCVIGTTEMIKAKPELVKGFMKALARGMEYMAANPDNASDIAAKYPGQTEELDKISWRMPIQNDMQQSQATKKSGFLWMESSTWDGMTQFYLDQKTLPRFVPAAEFATNDFNPGIQSK